MQPDSAVAAEMTACSQLTDIMIARPVKGFARTEMPNIRQWLKKSEESWKSSEVQSGTLGDLNDLRSSGQKTGGLVGGV